MTAADVRQQAIEVADSVAFDWAHNALGGTSLVHSVVDALIAAGVIRETDNTGEDGYSDASDVAREAAYAAGKEPEMNYTPKIAPNGIMAIELRDRLKALGRAVGEVNVANGWDTSRSMMADPDSYDPKWQIAHKIAELGLIDTEVSEAIEEVRHGHAMTETYYPSKGNPDSPFEKSVAFGPFKPEGVPSELADVVIRVLDIADAYGIDLGAAIIEKLNHNATRGMHHGGKAL